MLSQPDLQLRTLTLYGELLCRHPSWAHRLTLTAFEGSSDTGLAAASTLTGAASLTVDSDTALVKRHFRDGAFDFVVHTLDEALRALKNELRQGRPIAIALIAQPGAALTEAAERGVAANAIVCGKTQLPRDYTPVMGPDAVALTASALPSAHLRTWLMQNGWASAELPSATASFSDAVRQNWLRNLPALQRSARSATRFGWASIDEVVALNQPR